MVRYPQLKQLAKEYSALVEARDGLLTIKVGDRYVHSLYSPGKEALRLLEPLKSCDPKETFVIIIGAGLGYHVELLEKEGFERGVVIEQHPEVAAFFQKVYELPSSFYWIGPEQTEEALDGIFALLDFSRIRFVKTIILRGSYELSDYRAFERRIQRLLEIKLGDFSTRLKFEEIWLIHMIRNLENLPFATPVNRLFLRQRGIPVLLVSAGPSLRESLPAIRRVASSFLVVAVDTALLPLYEAGIVPDVVYSLDAQVHTLEDFVGIDEEYLGRVRLIYDVVVHPETPRWFRRSSPAHEQYVATTAHVDIDPQGNPFLLKNEFVQWIELQMNTRLGDVETGGSVSTSLFHASFLFGGNPLILVGQDLAFSYQTTHVASTSHYYRYFPLGNRFRSLNTIFWEALLSRRLQKQRGIHEEVLSDFVLSNFKGWFEVSAQRLRDGTGVRCVNATREGVLMEGFETMDLDDAGRRFGIAGLHKKKMFVSERISGEAVKGVIFNLKKLSDEIRGLPINHGFFEALQRFGKDFLTRYYLRERMLFERYENFDILSLERKTFRLIKAIEGLGHE